MSLFNIFYKRRESENKLLKIVLQAFCLRIFGQGSRYFEAYVNSRRKSPRSDPTKYLHPLVQSMQPEAALLNLSGKKCQIFIDESLSFVF